jgi:hypothetical protein
VKILFVRSVVISGVLSFFGVKAFRQHEENKYDRKMTAVDDWLSQSTPK